MGSTHSNKGGWGWGLELFVAELVPLLCHGDWGFVSTGKCCKGLGEWIHGIMGASCPAVTGMDWSDPGWLSLTFFCSGGIKTSARSLSCTTVLAGVANTGFLS